MPGPAATITHMHTCPMWSGNTPHVGGPVIGPGVSTVLIGGKPAAVMGDQCTCSGPPDVIVKGEATVLIGGKPAATMGSTTAHGGVITVGEPTVLFGTGGSGASAVMAVKKIPFPTISLINKILGNNKTAIANQEAIRKEAESTEGEPRIYGVQWVVEEQRVTAHKVYKEIKVRANVLNIPDGESITFSIKRPTKTTSEEGNITENEEDVVELTGTVQDKMVEVTWEIEKAPETEEETGPNNENTAETSQVDTPSQESSAAGVSEANEEEIEKIEKKVVVFFIGGASDKESYYGMDATNIIENEVRSKFDLKFNKNYTSYYLGYNEARGDDDIENEVINKISDIEHTAVYIVGHSLGGWNGAYLAQVLNEKGYNVDLLITLDPVGEGSTVTYISDIYWSTPKPNPNYWINIFTDPEDNRVDDYVADAGGQWIPKNGKNLKIHHKSEYHHGQAGKMFNEPLKDTNISASQMLEHFINEYLKK